MGEAYEPFTPITEVGRPTQEQLRELCLLLATTGQRIEAQTGLRPQAIVIPAAWEWKLHWDETERHPDGLPYATVCGLPVSAADIPEPLLGFR